MILFPELSRSATVDAALSRFDAARALVFLSQKRVAADPRELRRNAPRYRIVEPDKVLLALPDTFPRTAT